MCLLVTDCATPATLREISGCGAFLETNSRPPLHSQVQLQHPDAGTIKACVTGIAGDGIRISFAGDTEAMAFALTAITADMTHS